MTPETRAHYELVFHEAAHGVVAAAVGAKVHSLTVSDGSGNLHYKMFCDQDVPVGSVRISDPQFRAITKDCTVGYAGIFAVMQFSQVSFWEGVQRGGWSDYFGIKNLSLLLVPEMRPVMFDIAREWSEAIVEAEEGIIGMVAKMLAYEGEASEEYIHELLSQHGTQWEFAPWNDAHWAAFTAPEECDDEDDDDMDEDILELPTISVENPMDRAANDRRYRG
jgi:hypothetical protein